RVDHRRPGAHQGGVDRRRPRPHAGARRRRPRARGRRQRKQRALRIRLQRERAAPAAPLVKPVEDRSVARAAAGMGGVTAVSRLAGFARVLVIAAVLGTTYLGNTFQAANSVSNVLFELLAAGALSAVLVPTFVRLIDAGDDGEADRLANGLLAYALVAM